MRTNVAHSKDQMDDLRKHGHEINENIYTTAQLQLFIKQNFLFSSNELHPDQFKRMLGICLVNYFLSPILGVSLMLD